MAFTVKNRVLVISEHQSTINENMPLRHLIYLGRTLEKLIEERSMYRQRRIGIPTPEFYVFYNGNDPFPAEKIMRISDAYLDKPEHHMLELEVKVININLTSGHKLLEQCRPMYEYSWLIQRIKDYLAQDWDRDEAITQAVKDCKQNGILVEFAQKYGSEAVNMLYTQFNIDDAKEVWQEEAYEDGKADGELNRSRQVIYDFLDSLGEIPEDIRTCIDEQRDAETLKKWYMAAPGVRSFEEFRESMAKCADFKNGSEAVNMLYTQFNIDDAKEVWQEEAYEDGMADGELNRGRQYILDLLEDLGEIPEDIRSRINTEENTETLRIWHKAAARAQSFDHFREVLQS